MAEPYTLPVISEENKKQWYAEYYYMDQAPIEAEMLRELDKPPMDPKDAIIPENGNMDMLLDPASIKVKTGYCLLPNGGGYTAVNTKLPDITIDMYRRWNEWRMEANTTFRYKVWHPRSHIDAVGSWIVEDIGEGPFEVYFQQPTTAENVGLDPAAVAKSNLLMLDGASSLSRQCTDSITQRPGSMIVCHLMYQCGAGIEMHSRFWRGYTLGDAGLEFVPHTRPAQEYQLNLLAHHCGEEMANMRRILPAIVAHDKA